MLEENRKKKIGQKLDSGESAAGYNEMSNLKHTVINF